MFNVYINELLGNLFLFYLFYIYIYIYIYMNIVLTNKYNKKLQSPGALNIKETPGYKQKDNLKNNK